MYNKMITGIRSDYLLCVSAVTGPELQLMSKIVDSARRSVIFKSRDVLLSDDNQQWMKQRGER